MGRSGLVWCRQPRAKDPLVNNKFLALLAVIGLALRALIEALLTDRVVERLRAAQGVLRFAERYGAERLEGACARALAHDNVQYRTVKTILARGLDREALVVVPHALLADEAEAELVDDAARSAVAGDVADGNLV